MFDLVLGVKESQLQINCVGKTLHACLKIGQQKKQWLAVRVLAGDQIY